MHSFACSMNFSSPSFIEIELTIGLPCTHFRPASITSHFDESIMIGTREISGSDAIRLRKVRIATTPSSMPSSMRSEEHTSELQSLMRISYAVFCLTKQNTLLRLHNKTWN